MTDEAKRIEINQAIEYLREDACVSCIFNSFIGECTSVSDCYARKAADLIESLSAELEQIKRERDALLKDINMLCMCDVCTRSCKYDKPNPYYKCADFEWRGLQEK